MKKSVMGLGAAALLASVAFAADPGNSTMSSSKIDTSSSAFTKLDADGDGRVSATEAANNTQLAGVFSQADADKDGYLSRDEFKAANNAKAGTGTDTTAPKTQSDTTLPPDSSTTTPQSDTTPVPQH